MAVIIESVDKKSPAYRARIKAGYTLLSINGEEIADVLDYRFYQNDTKLLLEYITDKGKIKRKKIKTSFQNKYRLSKSLFSQSKNLFSNNFRTIIERFWTLTVSWNCDRG